MASVTYKIKGHYDPKAMNSAKAGMQNLAKTAGIAAKAAAGLIAAKALGGVQKIVQGSADSFLKQNNALKNFQTAVTKANLPVKEMIDLRTQLSHGNFFDDDTLNNAIALGANMQLTKEQMQDVLTAAHDMAASGILPLDTAVKQLASTYTGTAGTLGKISPQIKQLTKDQLANGEAVKILKNQYKGYAEQMTATFGGRNTQFKNAFSDLKNEAGALVQSFTFISQGTFLEPVQKMTSYLHENRDNILRLFYAMPSMLKEAFAGIKEMIAQTFTKEGLINLVTFIGKTILITSKQLVMTVLDLIIASIKTLINFTQLTLGNLFVLIKNKLIVPAGNFLIETINTALQKILDSKAVKWIAENIFHSKGFDGSNVITFRFEESKYLTLDEALEREKENYRKVGNNFVSSVKEAVEKEAQVFSETGEFYKETAEKTTANIRAAYEGTSLPEDLQYALTQGAGAVQNAIEDGFENADTPATDSGEQSAGSENSFLNALLGSLGQIGSTIQAFISGSGPVGLLVSLVTEIFSQLCESSEIVSQVFNYMTTVVQEFIEPLAQIIEFVLEPVLDILKAAGKTVGILLNLLKPVIIMIQGPLKVLLKAVSYILKALYNAVVAIHNFFDWKHKWSYYSDTAAEETSATTATTSSGSNSVTAARDVYVYITYNHSYVNGDTRMIALNIRDEIRRAEKLGY